jgi:hypothetical protein
MSTEPVFSPSNIMNQPIESLSPDQAQARRDHLAADQKFQDRIAAKDAAAFEEHTKLWRVAHGMSPEPQVPINAMNVMTETIGRELQSVQMRAESLRGDGLNETQIYEYLNGRPMPLGQRQIHERELRVLKSDTGFVQRYLAGDLAARAEMRRHNTALTMRVGTLDEINAWERAHLGKKPGTQRAMAE